MFKKDSRNQINFINFFDSFRRAGAIKIINFEDNLNKLIKKFSKLVDKTGNFNQVWSKLDKMNNGYVTLLEFQE